MISRWRAMKMASLEEYIPIVKRLEGGYAEVAGDKGGATMYGITLNTFRTYYGLHKTKEDLKRISPIQYHYIVRKGYWNPFKADKIASQKIANMVVDWGFNSGSKTAIKQVQRIIGCRLIDGIVGNETLGLINSYDPDALFDILMEERRKFFRNIVLRNPYKAKFLKGWYNRLERLKTYSNA